MMTSKPQPLADIIGAARRVRATRGLLALAVAFSATGAMAEPPLRLSSQVIEFTRGLICAPPEGGRRDAPDTASGWIHVPDAPIRIRLEGTTAPALLGTGFGLRFLVDGDAPFAVRYVVHHPPMPPTGMIRQSWESVVMPGIPEQVFFQFDVEDELLPGAWSFTAESDGMELFHAGFDVVAPGQVPHLTGLCLNEDMLAFSRTPLAVSD